MNTATRTETGALQRLTVEHLTGAGFAVSLLDNPDDSRVQITGDGVVWLLAITDRAEADLVRWPTDSARPDPHQLAGLAATLLTGRPDTTPAPDTARRYPEVRFDGIAGRDLRDRGFAVELKTYIDDVCFDILSEVEVTDPADPHAMVRIGDEGVLSWHRDYQPDCDDVPDPDAVARAITAAIAPALAPLAGTV